MLEWISIVLTFLSLVTAIMTLVVEIRKPS
jgi:hypothetical protein